MRRSLTRNKNFKKATANPECGCPDFLDEFAGYIKIKNRRFPTETMFELTKLPFTHCRVNGTTAQRKSKKFYLFNTLSSTGIRNNSDHTVKMEKDLVLLKAPFISHLFILLCISSNTYS